MVVKLPVPADYFECPPLDDDIARQLMSLGKQIASEVAEHAKPSGGPIQWNLVSDEKYMKLYSGIDEKAPADIVNWLAESHVLATLDEIAQLLYTPNTEGLREFNRVFCDDVKDAIRLYNVVTPSPSQPRQFVGVNWMVQDAPSRGFGQKYRDWCFVECHDDVVVNGRRGWVQSFRSVELPCCPDQSQAIGCVRCKHFRSGLVFVETERRGELKVLQLSQLEVKSDHGRKNVLGDCVVQNTVKKRNKTLIDRLERALRGFRMSKTEFATPMCEDKPQTRSTHCCLCQKKFGLLLRSTKCRKCMKVVCRNETCSDLWDIPFDGIFTNLRICTYCSIATSRKASTKPKKKSRKQFDDDDGQSSVASSENGRYTSTRHPRSSKRSSGNDDDFLDTWRSTLVIDMGALESIPRSEPVADK